MSIIPFDYQDEYEEQVVVTQATVSGQPSDEIVDVFNSEVKQVTSRIEMYEADGKTRWFPEGEIERLVSGGNVNVDYNSAERRKLDITLENEDNALRIDPFDGLWYDKVIKAYSGCRYQVFEIEPRFAIIESLNDASTRELIKFFSSMGFNRTTSVASRTTNAVNSFTYLIAYSGSSSLDSSEFLKAQYDAGKNIVTIGSGNGPEELSLIDSAEASVIQTWGISPAVGDYPGRGSFGTASLGSASAGRRATAVAAGVSVISIWSAGESSPGITAMLNQHANGAYWIHFQLPVYDNPEVYNLLKDLLNYTRGYISTLGWETQVGEFMIDRLESERFVNHVKITGRDYSKKMLRSKFGKAVTFAAGLRINNVLNSLAVNSGVDPLRIDIRAGSQTLSSEFSYDGTTDRWTVAKEICDSYDLEIFFNQFGTFVVRPFRDPTTSPSVFTFATGYDREDANLADYSRAVHDTRVYNKVIVTAQPTEGEDALPYYGEAVNNDPSSPTSVQRLKNEIVLNIEAPYLSSDAECKALAISRLSIAALESYEISWTSTSYPWSEVGEIADFLDPLRSDIEPTKFLLDSITISLDTNPMSATGKRITYIGSAGSPEEIPEDVN